MEGIDDFNLPELPEEEMIEDDTLHDDAIADEVDDDVLEKGDNGNDNATEGGSPISKDFIDYLKEFEVEVPDGVTTYEDLVVELINKQRINSSPDDEVMQMAKAIAEVGPETFLREYYLGTKEFDEQLSQLESLDDYSLIKSYFVAQGYEDKEAEEKTLRISKRGDEYMRSFREDIMDDIRSAIEKKKQEVLNERLSKIKESASDDSFVKEYTGFRDEIASTIDSFEGFEFLPLNESRKKELFDFVTGMDEDGYTFFEKYIQDPKNLLTLAYISMYWDDFMTSLINHYTNGVKEEVFETIRDVRDETKRRAIKPGTVSRSVMDEY